jgi:hypothetical protein
MRFVEKIFDRVASGRLFGTDGAPNGRVTVEPGWMLRATEHVYGNSLRGPYRYYLDKNRVEYEVPAIQSINISRSSSQNIATCQITIYNSWHEANNLPPEQLEQLGKPGYFWPKRGEVNDTTVDWNHAISTGAYKHYPPGHADVDQEGDWDPDFSWRNVLVEDALIRTYQGYGNRPTEGYWRPSIQANISNGNIVMTGVWLVDSVIGNSSGLMILNCRDVGRLMLDQIVFPPTVPTTLYPLEYIPAGKSKFDSTFGARTSGLPSSAYGSRGPVKIAPMTASSAGTNDPYVLANPIAASVDGNIQDFALTEAFPQRIDGENGTSTAWFEYDILNSNQEVSSIAMTPWGGGYRVYVSAWVGGGWVSGVPKVDSGDTMIIPATTPGAAIPYVTEIYIPETIPGGSGRGESEVYAELRRQISDVERFLAGSVSERERQKLYGKSSIPEEDELVQLRDVDKIRISFQRFLYSGLPDGAGNQFRAGLRTVKAFCLGQDDTPYNSNAAELPWTWKIASHPVRGYWIIENSGTVHGFGDAADYDSDSPGLDPQPAIAAARFMYVNNAPQHDGSSTLTQNRAHGLTPTPSGMGYLVVDWMGNVTSYGDATYLGQRNLAQRFGPSSNNLTPERQADGRATQPMLYRQRTPTTYIDTDGNLVYQPPTGTDPRVFAVDISMTYDGEGYWVLYSDGAVSGWGSARNVMPPGSIDVDSGWGSPLGAPRDYGFFPGKIGFANLNTPTMQAYGNILSRYFIYGRVEYGFNVDPARERRGVAIAAHPNGLGFWAVNGCGEVAAYGAAQNHGGFINRRYLPGTELGFDMKLFDYPTEIVPTDTGMGYWILCSSGMVAAFGDAIHKGPLNLESINKLYEDNVSLAGERFGVEYFRALFYGMARDQDGRGYWLQRADGEVDFYESTDWGNPGWTGLTGYRWHEGNFSGDYAQIVKEVAMWSGFTDYEPEKDSGSVVANPAEGYDNIGVVGVMETTAIEADIEIQGDKWDKKFIIDIVNELSEVVGYSVYVDQEGGFRFESPNWWRSGNFDYNRNRIWGFYDVDGNFTRQYYFSETLGADGAALEAGAVPFIPEIHEELDMMSYSATISNTDKRWQIIIGTDTPDPRDINRTAHVQHFPPFANQEVSPGVPSLRNIPRTSIWTSHIFENADERQLMAEIIGIHNYFASRTGTTSAVANPCLDLEDQVRLIEKNTSETYIHRIKGIDTEMNLDDGTYTMSLQTHWLGSAGNWVLVTTSDGEPWDDTETYSVGARVSYGGNTYVSTISENTATPGSGDSWVQQTSIDSPLVVISDRLDSWQLETGRRLELSGYAATNPYSVQSTGGFTSTIFTVSSTGPEWGLWYTGSGEMSSNATLFQNVNYQSLGGGLLWPIQQSPPVNYADNGEDYAAARLLAQNQNFILTLGDTPTYLI